MQQYGLDRLLDCLLSVKTDLIWQNVRITTAGLGIMQGRFRRAAASPTDCRETWAVYWGRS